MDNGAQISLSDGNAVRQELLARQTVAVKTGG
jgi:hypothetical protein